MNNALKFSNEYLEQSKPDGQLTSYTFIEEQEESMFDLKSEKVLQGLVALMDKRIEFVKTSPYYAK